MNQKFLKPQKFPLVFLKLVKKERPLQSPTFFFPNHYTNLTKRIHIIFLSILKNNIFEAYLHNILMCIH